MQSANPTVIVPAHHRALTGMAVSGHEPVKRYGHRSTAVEACRSVTVASSPAAFTATWGHPARASPH